MLRVARIQGPLVALLAIGLLISAQGVALAKTFVAKSAPLNCSDIMLSQSSPEYSGPDIFYAQMWEQRTDMGGKCEFIGDVYARGVFYSNPITYQSETVGAFYTDQATGGTNHTYTSYSDAHEGQSVASSWCNEGDYIKAEATFSGTYPWNSYPIPTHAYCPATYGG